MFTSKSIFVLFVLYSLSFAVAEEVEELQPLVKSTEDTLQKAKTHVDHMLNLSPLPHEDKLAVVVKNESEHLAYEIKKLANTLQEKVAVGEHKPEVKEAVGAAVTHLTEAAETLHNAGSDLKQDNSKYYAVAEKLLHESQNILAAGPCQQLAPVIKGALNELSHDVNNYQYGIHDVVGPHEGSPSEAGHHDNHHHHTHQHHGHSSEESNESHDKSNDKSSSSSDHHHHH